MKFKDLFSGHSQDYAKFRPHYPKELFSYLSSLVAEREQAWDCGTGNGQAAIELANYFSCVRATDPSMKQLESATTHEKVIYSQAKAEDSGLNDQSVSLVTVAQAFHWFEQDRFFSEVRRVVRPKGVMAIWCYELAEIQPDVDAVMMKLYDGILGPYWEKERKLVDEGYRKVHFPFERIVSPVFDMKAHWSLEHYIGYLGTWSGRQNFLKKEGYDPLELLFPEFEKAWGMDSKKPVSWPVALHVFRI